VATPNKDVVDAIVQSIKAIDDDYTEEMRELRALYEEARREAEKDEPNDVKLRALVKDAGEMARTFATLDPVWQAVQRVSRLFGI
jgi:hypothetical protein